MAAIWVERIRERFEKESTEELLARWTENDRERWAQEAFEATKQILESRGIVPPPQKPYEPVPIAAVHKPRKVFALRTIDIFWVLMIVGIVVGIGELCSGAYYLRSVLRFPRRMPFSDELWQWWAVFAWRWIDTLLAGTLIACVLACLLRSEGQHTIVLYAVASLVMGFAFLIWEIIAAITAWRSTDQIGSLLWIGLNSRYGVYPLVYPAVLLFFMVQEDFKNIFRRGSGFEALVHEGPDGSHSV